MTIDIFKPEDFFSDGWPDEAEFFKSGRELAAKLANEKLEKVGLVMYQGGTSSGDYIVTKEFGEKNKYFRPHSEVLVLQLKKMPPCKHLNIGPSNVDSHKWACESCGVEMVPIEFKVKE